MLNKFNPYVRSNEVTTRRLVVDRNRNPESIGCHVCPLYDVCGGIAVEADLMDCLDLCCKDPSRCGKVCPNNVERYVDYRREVVGFEFSNVPRAPCVSRVRKSEVAELVYHGSSRHKPLVAGAIALRLADLIDFRHGRLRFTTRESLCDGFKIDPGARIIISGVDHDRRIEPWWTLGATARSVLLADLAPLGIDLVTTPNFSLVLDHPRYDDLHAMKRIGITFAEFQDAGIACALHPNGRTERDFERWTEFVAERPEVETLAYEFITGPGQQLRKQFHLDSLARVAEGAGRPLDIVVRGDPGVVVFLREHFRHVVYIDTMAFMKALKRQSAHRLANDALEWKPYPTPANGSVDALLQHDVDEQIAYLRATFFAGDKPYEKAA